MDLLNMNLKSFEISVLKISIEQKILRKKSVENHIGNLKKWQLKVYIIQILDLGKHLI